MKKQSISTTDAVAMYAALHIGEKCKYCLVEFKTLDDLKGTVFVGVHEHGTLAHKACWLKSDDILTSVS